MPEIETYIEPGDGELETWLQIADAASSNWPLMVVETPQGAEIWHGKPAKHWPYSLEREWLIARFEGPNIALHGKQEWLASLASMTITARDAMPHVIRSLQAARKRIAELEARLEPE